MQGFELSNKDKTFHASQIAEFDSTLSYAEPFDQFFFSVDIAHCNTQEFSMRFRFEQFAVKSSVSNYKLLQTTFLCFLQ